MKDNYCVLSDKVSGDFQSVVSVPDVKVVWVWVITNLEYKTKQMLNNSQWLQDLMNEVDTGSIGTFNFPNFLNMMLRYTQKIFDL